jgi:hypothetical protein
MAKNHGKTSEDFREKPIHWEEFTKKNVCVCVHFHQEKWGFNEENHDDLSVAGNIAKQVCVRKGMNLNLLAQCQVAFVCSENE